MGCFLGTLGYYEGDRAHALDQEVPQRPDATYVPQLDGFGVFVQWTIDAAAQQSLADKQTIIDDAQRIALVNALRNKTNDQIDTYINANVTDLPSARLMLSRMAKVLALLVG